MARFALCLLASVTLAACAGAPDVPPTALLTSGIIPTNPEGYARDLCRNAAQANGLSVLSISDVVVSDGGVEMLLDVSDDGARSTQRCIMGAGAVVLGAA